MPAKQYNTDIDYNSRMVTIKNFYDQSQPAIYAAKLNENGIPSFTVNSISYTVIPVGEQGISLMIREEDSTRAIPIIKELEQNQKAEQNFRDANLEDILFQKELHQPQSKTLVKIIAGVILVLFIGAIVLSILQYYGLENLWFNY